MKSERGYSIIEMMVYIAVLTVIIALAFGAFYRSDQSARGLRRNADDITRALHAGERWRDDVRAANAAPSVDGNVFVIPQPGSDVLYTFADGTLWRETHGSRVAVLHGVKDSIIRSESRQQMMVWSWDLELVTGREKPNVRPLFSFLAVAPNGPS